MNEPLVSIIVPVYNASNYIEETIRSVKSQTHSNWELIIINDGSTDNTAELISPFLSDSRISLYSQPNSGVCKARNNGFVHAKGDYISLLDADDIFLPQNIEKKLLALELNAEADWAFSNLNLIDENSKIIKDTTDGKSGNILENILLWNGEVIPGPCSNLFFKKTILEKGISFDPEFSTAADQDFCIQLAGSFKWVFLPDVLASYRFLENSMSRNIAVMEKDHLGVYKKAGRNNLFKSNRFKRHCFSNLYLILAGSWWVNGNNKRRAIYFMWKSVCTYPLNIFRLIKKHI